MAGGVPRGESDRKVPYDYDRIDHQVTSALAVEQGWNEVLRGAEAITLPLAYEDLAADLPGAVRRLCAHVGVDLGDAPIAAGIKKAGQHMVAGDGTALPRRAPRAGGRAGGAETSKRRL